MFNGRARRVFTDLLCKRTKAFLAADERKRTRIEEWVEQPQSRRSTLIRGRNPIRRDRRAVVVTTVES